MKFIGKMKKENGITVLTLSIIVIITIIFVSIVIKAVFDSQSIGATDEKEKLDYLVRKIYKLYSTRKHLFEY